MLNFIRISRNKFHVIFVKWIKWIVSTLDKRIDVTNYTTRRFFSNDFEKHPLALNSWED